MTDLLRCILWEAECVTVGLFEQKPSNISVALGN